MSYGEGTHWAELTPFTRRQNVVAAFVLGRETQGFVTLATLAGMVKRVRVDDLPGLTTEPFLLLRVEKGDALGWAVLTSGQEEILLSTAVGQTIRFREEEIRPMGLAAGGVMGIKLKGDTDGVVSLQVVQPQSHIWTITDNGFAKATPIGEYPTQGRHGQGVINLRLPKDAVEVVAVLVVDEASQIYLKMTTGAVKGATLAQTKQGSRSITAEELHKVGPRSRVAGAVLLRELSVEGVVQEEVKVEEAKENTAVRPQQLALLG
jgi:DNA gyrase subunit A